MAAFVSNSSVLPLLMATSTKYSIYDPHQKTMPLKKHGYSIKEMCNKCISRDQIICALFEEGDASSNRAAQLLHQNIPDMLTENNVNVSLCFVITQTEDLCNHLLISNAHGQSVSCGYV